jgi:phosphoenolpyruvate carboxykinase (ATP)
VPLSLSLNVHLVFLPTLIESHFNTDKVINPSLTYTSTRPGKSHTELEEELHEHAHIDYERVAIVSLPSGLVASLLAMY